MRYAVAIQTRFLLSRLLGAAMVLAGMSFAVFALMGLMPGDPMDLLATADPDTTPETIAHLRSIYGLDTPLPQRYAHWLTSAIQGDFGFSRLQHRPVLGIVWNALGNTIILTGTAFLIASGVAIGIGTLAAVYRRRWPDRVISVLSYAGLSIPTFWLGLMLIYAFSVTLRWLPASGTAQFGEGVRVAAMHLALPVLTLVIGEIGAPTRYVRAAMLDVLDQDYIRTARAKGLPARLIILKHALQNALIPVVTILALGLGELFSGALLTETVFAWRGMGRLIYESVMGNDYNVALVCLLLSTACILAANVLADFTYTWLDPRITLAGGTR